MMIRRSCLSCRVSRMELTSMNLSPLHRTQIFPMEDRAQVYKAMTSPITLPMTRPLTRPSTRLSTFPLTNSLQRSKSFTPHRNVPYTKAYHLIRNCFVSNWNGEKRFEERSQGRPGDIELPRGHGMHQLGRKVSRSLISSVRVDL